jgi:hypothetical protein
MQPSFNLHTVRRVTPGLGRTCGLGVFDARRHVIVRIHQSGLPAAPRVCTALPRCPRKRPSNPHRASVGRASLSDTKGCPIDRVASASREHIELYPGRDAECAGQVSNGRLRRNDEIQALHHRLQCRRNRRGQRQSPRQASRKIMPAVRDSS